MRIDQVTKYRCDGCGREAATTYGWASLTPLIAGMTGGYNFQTGIQYPDYCDGCLKTMREAVNPARR